MTLWGSVFTDSTELLLADLQNQENSLKVCLFRPLYCNQHDSFFCQDAVITNWWRLDSGCLQTQDGLQAHGDACTVHGSDSIGEIGAQADVLSYVQMLTLGISFRLDQQTTVVYQDIHQDFMKGYVPTSLAAVKLGGGNSLVVAQGEQKHEQLLAEICGLLNVMNE
jgi:hypothetical protein